MSRDGHEATSVAIDGWNDTGFRDTGYSTQDYVLAVGCDDPRVETAVLRYCVINRRFGVIEYSSGVLTIAVTAMHDLQRAIVQQGLSPYQEDKPTTGVYQ